MKYIFRVLKHYLTGLILLILVTNCSQRSAEQADQISENPEAILQGQTLFQSTCSSCHDITQDGIGPHLGGITQTATPEWITGFIKNPQQVLQSDDERGKKLFERYNSFMPSFAHLKETEISNLIAFLHTQDGPKEFLTEEPGALKDPVPDTISLSNLVADLELVTQIPFSSENNPRTRIAKIDCQPGKDDLFVLDLRGKLYRITDGKPAVYMDMPALRKNFIPQPGLATGFGSFAFHPAFTVNGLMYTTHTEPSNTSKADFTFADSIPHMLQWVLTEWKTDQPNQIPFSGEGRELFRIDMVHSFHGVQEITFNPLAKPGSKDYGMLYIGIGDGASVEMGYSFLVRNSKTPWGAILRIDPSGKNSRNGQYGIPSDNPLASFKDPETCKEIYANGFRNPHRISWSKAGEMLVSNIGHGNIESLNLIVKGGDYGWPVREGAFLHLEKGNMNVVFPLPADDVMNGIQYPVAMYDHDEGLAISGGYEYQGKISALKEKYFFGDISNGRLFFVNMPEIHLGDQAPIYEWQVRFEGKRMTMAELCGNNRVELRLGHDRTGALYLFTKPDGKVYKLVSAGYL